MNLVHITAIAVTNNRQKVSDVLSRKYSFAVFAQGNWETTRGPFFPYRVLRFVFERRIAPMVILT